MKITAWLRKNIIPLFIGLALAVGLGLSFGAWWLDGYWQGLLLNLGTEAIGAVATYFLFAWLIGRRETKAALIAQMCSSVRERAIAAVEELRQRGWLSNGSLRGAILDHANLPGAYLSRANLQGAHLARADLRRADFLFANLQEARLFYAKLQGACLSANLQGACLRLANLQGADLGGGRLQGAKLPDANLQGANLTRANLKGADLFSANLQGAEFKHATLPDGTRWTPHTDMARFTNPKHPDYWRPPRPPK